MSLNEHVHMCVILLSTLMVAGTRLERLRIVCQVTDINTMLSLYGEVPQKYVLAPACMQFLHTFAFFELVCQARLNASCLCLTMP